MNDLALHVHQRRARSVGRSEEVQPRLHALGPVDGDPRVRTGWLGSRDIADRAQGLDQIRFDGLRSGVAAWLVPVAGSEGEQREQSGHGASDTAAHPGQNSGSHASQSGPILGPSRHRA